MKDSKIISKRRYPSPHPQIKLFIVTYESQGLKIKGLLAEKKDGKKYPAILYLRGGIKGVGQVKPAEVITLSAQGFIVFAPFYRGNRGGEGREDFIGEDRHDGFAAYELLRRHPKVTKIHLLGFSRGGPMALFTAMNYPDAASIVTWGGVSDLFLTYEERIDLRRMMKRVIGGTPRRYPERYQFRTPLNGLEKISVPVLIIHGEEDAHVSITHGYRLEKELKKQSKNVTTAYYPHVTHHFPPALNRAVIKEMTNWMKAQE